uniref:FAR1 domain-containing protein n=1 Tax=Panagrellus redivivus TaxID=6233 RepID=A0A7E4ULV4_PANRE
MTNDENTPMPTTEAYFDYLSATHKGVIRPVLKAKRPLQPKTPTATATTLSSSPIPAEIIFADDICENAVFRDFDHFTKVRKAYQQNTHTEYRIDSSSRMDDAYPQEIKEKYRYKMAVYTCCHGKPRTRSTGKRTPKQSQALGCKSRMRLLFDAATKTIRITVLNLKHNHVCAPPQFDQKGHLILPALLPESDGAECPAKRPKLDLPATPISSARTPLAPINRMPSNATVEPASSVNSDTSTDSINSEQSDESIEKSDTEIVADQMLTFFKQIVNPDVEDGTKAKLRDELGQLIEMIRSVQNENAYSAECIRQLEIWRNAC